MNDELAGIEVDRSPKYVPYLPYVVWRFHLWRYWIRLWNATAWQVLQHHEKLCQLDGRIRLWMLKWMMRS